MGYIGDYVRYHLKPKYCELLKEERIQRLKDDMLYDEKTTEVDVLSHYDITTDTHKLLVVIDRTRLISLEIDLNSRNLSSFFVTQRVMEAYKERFGVVEC